MHHKMNFSLKYSICLIAFFSLALLSCKKETSYSTMYPLSYLPVYPGSYWKYINKNGDTVVQTTDAEYKLDSYVYSVYQQTDIMTVPVYVPVWNGHPVYGYSTPVYNAYYRRTSLVAYLSEVQGQSWGVDNDPHFGSVSRQVVNTDTSLTLNAVTYSHIIKVTDSVHYTNPYISTSWASDAYYAKDIGLVLQLTSSDTLSLLSYYIKR
jgi:hypothetical protein